MFITGEVLKEIPSEEEITGTIEKSGLENRHITSFWSVYGLLCCCCFLNQHLKNGENTAWSSKILCIHNPCAVLVCIDNCFAVQVCSSVY